MLQWRTLNKNLINVSDPIIHTGSDYRLLGLTSGSYVTVCSNEASRNRYYYTVNKFCSLINCRMCTLLNQSIRSTLKGANTTAVIHWWLRLKRLNRLKDSVLQRYTSVLYIYGHTYVYIDPSELKRVTCIFHLPVRRGAFRYRSRRRRARDLIFFHVVLHSD